MTAAPKTDAEIVADVRKILADPHDPPDGFRTWTVEALLRQLDQQSWRPIETAPKDGTRILLWRAGWEAAYIARWGPHPDEDFCGWLSDNDGAFPNSLEQGFIGWSEEADDMPTHWLPEPLQGSGRDEG